MKDLTSEQKINLVERIKKATLPGQIIEVSKEELNWIGTDECRAMVGIKKNPFVLEAVPREKGEGKL